MNEVETALREELVMLSAPSPIGELAEALAKAQAEMTNPAFDKMNPHFKNKFASLAAIRNAVVPILSKHGIAITQELCNNDGMVGCITTLFHKSGQYRESRPFYIPVTKQDAQGYCSASTYARRYSLQSVCGVVGDEDDDGNAASKNGNSGQRDVPKTAQKEKDLDKLITQWTGSLPEDLPHNKKDVLKLSGVRFRSKQASKVEKDAIAKYVQDRIDNEETFTDMVHLYEIAQETK